jgi:hypothetical protein
MNGPLSVTKCFQHRNNLILIAERHFATGKTINGFLSCSHTLLEYIRLRNGEHAEGTPLSDDRVSQTRTAWATDCLCTFRGSSSR